MTNEEIYENVMGHKPNKEFGIKGSFSWDDIDALMNAVKNCSTPVVSNLLCGSFDPNTTTSSATNTTTSSDTKCKCGREKWEHPKAK